MHIPANEAETNFRVEVLGRDNPGLAVKPPQEASLPIVGAGLKLARRAVTRSVSLAESSCSKLCPPRLDGVLVGRRLLRPVLLSVG